METVFVYTTFGRDGLGTRCFFSRKKYVRCGRLVNVEKRVGCVQTCFIRFLLPFSLPTKKNRQEYQLGGGGVKCFHPEPWGNDPNWLILFRWVENTNE